MRRPRLLTPGDPRRPSYRGRNGGGSGVENVNVARRMSNLQGTIYEGGNVRRFKLPRPALRFLQVNGLRPCAVRAINEVSNRLNGRRTISPVGRVVTILRKRADRVREVYRRFRVNVPDVVPLGGVNRQVAHLLERVFVFGVEAKVVTKGWDGRT